jgi:hypothetical protein
MLIIGLGVTLSLVTGLNVYIYNARVYQLENFKNQVFDITLLEDNQNENFPLNGTQFYESNYAKVVAEVIEAFPITQHFPILQLTNDYVGFESTEADTTDVSTNHLEWLFSNPAFYESKDFAREYTLYSGRLPQNETEYVIDLVSAVKMGLIAGQTNHAQLSIKNDTTIHRSYPLSNPSMIVVGVVIPQFQFCELLSRNSRIIMSYSLEQVKDIITASVEEWVTGVAMGVMDVENLQEHPMLLELDVASHLFNQTNWEIYAGVGFTYDRSIIDPNYLSQAIVEFQTLRSDFYSAHSQGGLEIHNNIPYDLDAIQSDTNELFIYQILTVPLFFCIIFISQLLVKTAFYPRFEEIQLSLMKGYPKKMILTQLLVEILLMGISVGLLSIGFSRGLYGSIQTILNPTLERLTHSGSALLYARLVAPTSPLPFIITPSLLLWTCVISLVTTLVIYLQLMARVNNLQLHSLTDYLDQRDLAGALDENVLLKKPKKTKHKVKSKNDPIRSDKSQQYKSQEFYHSRHLRRFGWIFVVIGGISPLITLVMQVGSRSTLDFLAYLSQYLYSINQTLTVLNFFSPMLLIYGVLRIMLFERAIWYSRLCGAFSAIFIGEKSLINALETFRNRHLKSISIFLAIITGMFIFTNLSIYSNQNIEPTIYNAQIGTDLNIHTANDYDAMAHTINNISSQDLLELVDNFENLSLEGEENSPAVTCPVISLCDLGQRFSCMVLTNLSRYRVIVQQPTVMSHFPQLEAKLIALEVFNAENPNIVGILAAQSFLDTFGYSVGESFIINPRLFPFTGNFAQRDPIEVQIIDKVANFPGYYNTIRNIHPILMDIREIWEENITITYDTLNILVGFSQESDLSTQIPFSEVYREIPEKFQTQLVLSRYDYSVRTSGIFQFSMGEEEDLSLFLIYIELMLILLFVGLSILFLVNLYQRSNEAYYGTLLIQGFGKRNLHLMILAQLLFTIGFSFLVGTILGTITGLSWTYSLLSAELAREGFYGLSIPLTFNFLEYFVILLTLIGGTMVSYLLIRLRYRNKEYAAFLKRGN